MDMWLYPTWDGDPNLGELGRGYMYTEWMVAYNPHEEERPPPNQYHNLLCNDQDFHTANLTS